MGLNQFSIYSEEEFVQRFLTMKNIKDNTKYVNDDKLEAIIVDWVANGAVTPVKNQGTCGTATLYATLGAV